MPVDSPKRFSILPAPEIKEGEVHSVPPALPGEELDLLHDYRDPDQPKFFRAALIGSLLVHGVLFFLGTRIESLVTGQTQERTVIVHKTPIYYRPELTQRAPNKDKLTKQFNLEDLVAPQVQRQQEPASGHRQYKPQASAKAPTVQPRQVDISPEAPKINTPSSAPPPPGLPTGVIAQNVAPPPQSNDPFEKVGQVQAVPKAQSQVQLPSTALPDIARSMAHSAGPQQQSVRDDSAGLNIPNTPGNRGTPGRMGSEVELKSDPNGVDLRPYLAQILAIVRHNWFTVMPESVRMGTRRGRTVLQFAVNRDGTLAKVVISDFSGSDPLDRAAVAGLSMSNPLPPLPKEYRGGQLRLAFSFDYNLPKMP